MRGAADKLVLRRVKDDRGRTQEVITAPCDCGPGNGAGLVGGLCRACGGALMTAAEINEH